MNQTPKPPVPPRSAPRPIAAVVLAAGRSSRMGAHKLLLPLGGRPLVAHAVAAACASACRPVLVVVGYDAERVCEAAAGACQSHGARIVRAPDYAAGMSSSLRAGIAAVPPQCAGALALLGDQPLVGPDLLDRLLQTAAERPEAIVAASYAGRRGNPVYFPRAFFGELQSVAGDAGGRSVVARHGDRLVLVECADLGADLDVDDPDDYARAQALWKERR